MSDKLTAEACDEQIHFLKGERVHDGKWDKIKMLTQLAATLRENERLEAIEDRLITYGCHNPQLREKVTEILGNPYKESEHG